MQIGPHPDGRIPLEFRYVAFCTFLGHQIHKRSNAGYIEPIGDNHDGTYSVSGWACEWRNPDSVPVHVYAGPATGTGILMRIVLANRGSEPAVANACGTSGSSYRFLFQLTGSDLARYGGLPIYIYATSPFGIGNTAIGNSGAMSVPTLSVKLNAMCVVRDQYTNLPIMKPNNPTANPLETLMKGYAYRAISASSLTDALNKCNDSIYSQQLMYSYVPGSTSVQWGVAIFDDNGNSTSTCALSGCNFHPIP